MAPSSRAWSVVAGLCCLGACQTLSSAPEDAWYQTLEPDGACYRVDLGDGLTEADTSELEDLFDCLNAHGHLQALERTFSTSLFEQTRAGEPTAIELARLFNRLPEADLDPIGLVTTAVEWLEHPNDPLHTMLDLTLELTTATRASRVYAGDVDLSDPATLTGGLLTPLAPLLPVVATSLLDDDLETTAWLADSLEGDELATVLDLIGAMSTSSDSDVTRLRDDLPAYLAEALEDTRDASNDHHPGASGDSLRDLVEVLVLADTPAIDALAPELLDILGDARARDNLEEALHALESDGTLENVPAELRWMVTIDPQGGRLESGEDSALYALLRLLDRGNTEAECSLDLWVTDLEINLGNLSVALLEAFADIDPDTVTSGVDLLSTVLGWGFTESVLESIADSEVCPVLDEQLLEDLDAVERLQDPEAYDLLVATLEVLSALKNADTSRIPELVDAVSTLRDVDAVGAVEEVVRDLGAGRLLPLLVGTTDLLLSPEDHGLLLPDGSVVDLDRLLDAIEVLLTREDGVRTWHTADALLIPVLADDATWEVLGKATGLLSDPDTVLGDFWSLVALVDELDPDREALGSAATLLANERLVTPTLHLVEAEDTVGAMLSPEQSADDAPAPLAWAATLITDGTLDDLLALVELVLNEAEN